MLLAAILSFAFCVAASLVAAGASCWMVRKFRSTRIDPPTTAPPQRTALLIPLRGADPRMASSLARLMRQDHPDYEIFIAVDSRDDPAWQIVRQAMDDAGATNVHISTLQDRLDTCTLKCSALLQLAAQAKQADTPFQVIAMADADLVAHPSWLRELVAPLHNATIGATYGNRWYAPNVPTLGALVRHFWNSAGVVIMTLTDAAWGGSLAVNADLFFAPDGIQEKWRTALCDDLIVRNEVLRQNRCVQFVPSLMMANRESCRLPFAYRFMKRQLMNTRSTVGSQWWSIIAATLLAIGVPVAIIALVVSAAWSSQLAALAWATAGIVVFLSTLFFSWFLLEKSVRRVIQAQGQAVSPLTWSYLAKLPLAAVLTAIIHLAAIIAATLHTKVTWRGITYQVNRAGDVRLLNYHPFAADSSPQPADASI